MFALIFAASAALLLSQPEPASAPEPDWLSHFGNQDQSAIAEAAKHFVVDRRGVFWDRQAEARRDSMMITGSTNERQCAAFGLGPTALWKSVPLWHAAAAGQTLYDPNEISAMTDADLPKGVERSRSVFVCSQILEPGKAIATEWIPQPGNLEGPMPHFKPSGWQMVISGHTFKATGEKLVWPLLREIPETTMGQKTYPCREIVQESPEAMRVRPVKAEQLAAAILRGSAKLTRWTWERKSVPEDERGPKIVVHPDTAPGAYLQGSVPMAVNPNRKPDHKFIWRAKDVTPKPETPAPTAQGT